MWYTSQKRFTATVFSERRPTVILAIPDKPLAGLYAKNLETDYNVVLSSPDLVSEHIRSHQPQAAILYVEPQTGDVEFIQRLRLVYPDLPVVTVGYLVSDEIIDALMFAGVVGHINRALSRIQDLRLIIKQTLTKA